MEALDQLLSVGLDREAVASQANMRCNRTVCRKEARCVSWGCEPLHPPFPLAGRLVGVFGAAGQIALLAGFRMGYHLPLGGLIALERSSPHHVRDVL